MKTKIKYSITGAIKSSHLLFTVLAALLCSVHTWGQTTIKPTKSDSSLKFPIYDHKENGRPDSKPSGMDLPDPSNVQKTVEYDEKENKYYFIEKVGDSYIRNPTYLTQEEYQKYRAQQDEHNYWRRRLDALTMFNKKPELPTMYKEGLFDRIFGGTAIQVRPQGNVDVTLGGNWQQIKNPALTQRQQKYGVPNFDLQMNINLLATIGDKMKLNISNNTKATFDFQNMQRIEYTGKEDEIIKKIEAGNTSFPLKSTLLSGRQSLFGIKTQLQFGKLWVTAVLSQQKSKQNSLSIQGGAQTQQFTIKADAYEENRNFLLAHYFHDNYGKTLQNFPVINSLVTINKIEVWITNNTGTVTGVRSVLAFMDLGEHNPYNKTLISGNVPLNLPDNTSNDLYSRLLQYPNARHKDGASTSMTSLFGLESEGRDYQITTARKLAPTEYTFNPQLGYISINTQPNPSDVIAVAFRYTYNGKVYQVGEFSEDLPPDSTNQRVIFLKLLKGTSNRPQLPIWQLMMKNVYALGGYGLSRDNFRLNILYQDPGGGEKRYLPEGTSAGIPLLTVLNLDRLNQQNDPSPDGVFDFVEGTTINTQQGKIIFPVLEPFGKDLLPAIGPDPVLQRKYPYQILYDSTKTVALQSQQNNRYVMRGSYKSASSSEISLGGFNIPQGSVQVTAGGQRLTENLDYQIDYGLGKLKILNTGILNSGIPINVQYEDNATFGFSQQNFIGTRFDYIFNPKLTLGGTFMRLSERPFTQKTTIGEDPIKNTNLGFDASYQSEFSGLTRLLDKLPIYSTTTSSFITASGEVAGIFPGHSKVIDGVDPGGTVYIDDFEGTRSSYDLKFPVQSWNMASTPANARNKSGNIMFPEATLDSLAYGYNRAKLAWYMLEPNLIDPLSGGVPGSVSKDPDQHYIRMVQLQEIFPQTSYNTLQNAISTLDLSYYPRERGPYNFDVNGVDPATGHFVPSSASKRWGGITRYIDNTDFEQSNVEFIEIWMMDPFIGSRSGSKGGSLIFNLGDVSEDALKDHSMGFENGITNPKNFKQLTATRWGYVPSFDQQITRTFDNDPTSRSIQDVGYDLLSNEEEKAKYQGYLNDLAAKVGVTSTAYLQAVDDPSNDNYQFFRDAGLDNAYILQRYKRYNNMEGNSPITNPNTTFSSAATTVPESEDLNRDNTLNEAENYYQYRIDLNPSSMKVGSNFITNKYDNPSVTLPNGTKEPETWYQFKIPIAEFQNKVGNISDFRSIRFMRMYLTDFEDSTTIRFARLQLGRNTWRKYAYSLLTPGENIPIDNSTTSFNLLSVSVEENSKRTPIPYVIPPGVTRQQQAVSNGQTVQQNEQSISLQLCNLKDGDSRGVFKSIGTNFDLRQFDRLRLFVHAESQVGQSSLQNGDLQIFLRIGSDFTNNYYEYRRPLNVTNSGAASQQDIWPQNNELNLLLNDLVNIKTRRNDKGLPVYVPYQETLADGSTIVVVGQPNIGDPKNMMLGVINPKKDNNNPSDDGLPKCGEIWFDELRVSGLSDRTAYAAAGKLNLQLADLGSIRSSGTAHTAGYGNIDQKINQRSQNSTYSYDISSNLNLGKLMPKDLGVQLPFFIGYSENVSNPKYNPYDLDVKMDDLLSATSNVAKRDSLRKAAQDFTSITSFNIANARILGSPKATKTKFYGIKNFDFSYSYNKQFKHNSMIASDDYTTQAFGLGYTYSFKPKSFEPFKNMVKSKSKWFALIKDFNFNIKPSNVTFRNDMNRVMNETVVRAVGDGNYKIAPTYFKNFIWTRTYNFRWDLTRSLSLDYNATNRSRVDEPTGRIDNASKRDSLWSAIQKLGRNTQFTQAFNASYSIPLNKLPITDWTSLKITYGSTFSWTAASRLAENLGNTLANTQQKQINGELNFSQLYNKNRWLRAVNQASGVGSRKEVMGKSMAAPNAGMINAGPKDLSAGGLLSSGIGNPTESAPGKELAESSKKPKVKKTKDSTIVPKTIDLTGFTDRQIDSVKKVQKAEELARNKAEALKKKLAKKAARLARRNSTPEVSDAERFGGKLLTMVKRATLNYTESGGVILPGFRDSTQLLGISSTGSPGLGYAFGYQPNLPWLNQLGNSGKLSRDTLFNSQFSQTFSQNINFTAQVEPISDLRIDLSLNRTFSKTHSELFKDTTYGATPQFEHLNAFQSGTFTQSYNALNTMFKPSSASSGTFLQFINNRPSISDRLGKNNPYTNGARDPNYPDYAKGYTPYSQEVLIPAFIAAYSGQSASSVPLLDYGNKDQLNNNPFKFVLPRPNWRITYNGLSKLPLFKKIFSNFVISSAYTGSLAMNSFNSALTYRDLLGVGFPSFIDSNSGNYIPYYQVPNITISDQLNPLFAVDIAFNNKLTTRFEVRKNRIVSLSLIDYQVSETKSQEFIFGLGYKVRGMILPFMIAGKRKLNNDLNVKVDVGIRDDKTTNTYIANQQDIVSRGQKVITISPTIDYLISQSLTLRIFYNRSQTIPYVSNSYPITTTSAGITLRFMFAQ
ncbi:MAG: cell surface protein SprA [Phycisphaerales bacterium]|nr:cell surface protein SprA [Phycisphaerales bacterium]